jgi:type IV secretion system protein VirD4
MDLDDIVLVVDAQMPVRAKRIKYYEDRFFKQIFDKQTGDLPYPSAGDQMRGLQGQIKALEAKIGALEVPGELAKKVGSGGGKQREEIEELVAGSQNAPSAAQASSGDYQVGTERVKKFMEDAVLG